MLWPLLVMLAAYGLLFVTVVLLRARNEVLESTLEAQAGRPIAAGRASRSQPETSVKS